MWDLELHREWHCHDFRVIWQVGAFEQVIHVWRRPHAFFYFLLFVHELSQAIMHLLPLFLVVMAWGSLYFPLLHSSSVYLRRFWYVYLSKSLIFFASKPHLPYARLPFLTPFSLAFCPFPWTHLYFIIGPFFHYHGFLVTCYLGTHGNGHCKTTNCANYICQFWYCHYHCATYKQTNI